MGLFGTIDDLSYETRAHRVGGVDNCKSDNLSREFGTMTPTSDSARTVTGQAGLPLDTPVLFLVFNRPETTRRVLETIRQARPRQLFVAADGPREHDPDGAQRCRAARDAALAVDWDCEVKTLLRTRNLGCKLAVSSAITWFFQHVDEGIILEDDTLPIANFFPFCQQQLAYYREDRQVMHIGGNSFQLGLQRGDGSYHFSNYNHIWGWATWRRAWKHYHPDVPFLDSFRRSRAIEAIFPNKADQDFWMQNFCRVARGEIDTWDYQWTLTIWNQGGLSLLPCVNLVANIGFDANATHTVADNCLGRLPVQDPGPLVHPVTRDVDREADQFTQRYIFSGRINNPDALVIDVASELDSERYEMGAVMSGQFLAMHPENVDLRWMRALALAKSGQMDRALTELTVLLTAHPEHQAGQSLLRTIRAKIAS